MGATPGSTDHKMCTHCNKVTVQNKCKDEGASVKYRCAQCGEINYGRP